MTAIDQRAHERRRHEVPVLIMVDGESLMYPGRLLDASRDGMRLATTVALEPGTRFYVGTSLDRLATPIAVAAQVVRIERTGTGFVLGVAYVSLSDSEQEAIETLRDQLARLDESPEKLVPGTGLEPV